MSVRISNNKNFKKAFNIYSNPLDESEISFKVYVSIFKRKVKHYAKIFTTQLRDVIEHFSDHHLHDSDI